MLCLLFGFLLGKFKQDILSDTLMVKSVDLETMKMRNNRLETDLARVEIISVADQQEIKSLLQSNKQLQDDLAIANNKLNLYEGIISPELDVTGVKIHSFKIVSNEQNSSWNYELVLMQSQKDRRLVNGSIDINFSIFEADIQKKVTLEQFSKDPIIDNFNFKYFQTIEGTFLVPVEIVIAEIIISLNVDGDKSYKTQNIEEHYDWRILTAQGIDDLNGFEQPANSPIEVE
jgi:hypothetical protein